MLVELQDHGTIGPSLIALKEPGKGHLVAVTGLLKFLNLLLLLCACGDHLVSRSLAKLSTVNTITVVNTELFTILWC